MRYNWNEEELALALELYLAKGIEWQNTINNSTYEVIQISRLLKGMDFFPEDREPSFRSENSVRLKLANLKSVDDRYDGLAMQNAARADKQIWEKYGKDYKQLKDVCRNTVLMHFKGETDPDMLSFLYKRYGIQLKDLTADRKTELNNEYRTHGGLNQQKKSSKHTVSEPSEEKIGHLVYRTIEEFTAAKLLTDDIVAELTDSSYSRAVFHLRITFLKRYDPLVPEKVQVVDSNNYCRYRSQRIRIAAYEYFITKEWFESQRKYYVPWMNGIRNGTHVTVQQFKDTLDEVKKCDQEKVFIEREDLNKFSNLERIITYLMHKGVLINHKNDTDKFVVDDYDMLADMINEPLNYISEIDAI